jgi:hypothetical protein
VEEGYGYIEEASQNPTTATSAKARAIPGAIAGAFPAIAAAIATAIATAIGKTRKTRNEGGIYITKTIR